VSLRPPICWRAGILLKECGLLDASGSEPYCPVGIVPLFETIDDLHRGASILEAALDLPVYQSIVRRPAATAKRSCSAIPTPNKDGGYLAANWALYRAETRPSSNPHAKTGIRLRLFHGRRVARSAAVGGQAMKPSSPNRRVR